MRAKLILVLAAAALAACGNANGPDTSNDGLDPSAVATVPEGPASGGRGASGGSDGGRAVPTGEVIPPCLESVRLASDLLPGPSSCRR
jgi:hypothetical protein